MAKPIISVVVPAYNEENFVGDCLDCLKAQDFTHPFEIILIDNSSQDKTAEIAQKKKVKVVKESQKGVIFALSTGVKHAQAPLIAFTDADCRPHPQWLSGLYRHFEENPNLDAVGGVFSFFDGSKLLDFFAWVTRSWNWHLSGGNMSIRKASLERIGGLKPAVNFGFDTELSLRLQKQGTMLIDPQNIMPTSARRFNHNLFKTLFTYLTNDLFLAVFQKPCFYTFSDVRKENLESRRQIMHRLKLGFTYTIALAGITAIIFSFFPTSIKAKTPLYNQVVEFTNHNLKQPYQTLTTAVEEKVKPYAATLNKYQHLPFKP